MIASGLFTGTLASQVDRNFLSEKLGQQTVLVEVGTDATAGLVSWRDLNDLLATRPFRSPQLRLSRNGTEVPVGSYTQAVGEGMQQRTVIKPDSLYACLREGASLILDYMHSVHPPVGAAVEDLVRYVHEPVQANLYVTWGTSQGFDAHWDDHDVFVVQVAGSKHWTVYGPSRPYPMKRDVARSNDCPGAVPWEGVVHEGEILHVPRGWWHEVRGAGDVSIHLTFGFARRTGIDWAESVVETLRHHELYRRDLPRFSPDHERGAHEHALRACLDQVLAGSSLEAYFSHRDELVPRRQRFSLPFPVHFQMPNERSTIEFTPLVDLELHQEGDVVTLTTARKKFRFSSLLIPLFHALNTHRTLRSDDLRRQSGLDSETYALALEVLVEQHLITIEDMTPLTRTSMA